MAKYDQKFKYKVVQAYFSGEGGIRFLSKKFDIKSTSTVKKWIKQFEVFGYEGLERKKNKQTYSMNFKIDVLNYYYQSGLGIIDVAIKFNIPSTEIVSRWKKEFDTFGIDGLKPKKKGRPSMSKKKNSLKKQNQPLTSENELLRAELAFIKKVLTENPNWISHQHQILYSP
ncbi:helix-turn-helix domain-containing protein [Vagococcus zengguangii]|uniref:helix-turn-helix domain-containing protein n=1 Tax=Vagococcus zengguangii TaxID=2571750 RepID=UPI0011098315|nr:helix-turn-helix domain-containing protein [Vagococcus zengguangii]TLG80929.1 transposase [Vagococcus zengguangii]